MKCRKCGKLFRQDTSKGRIKHLERICSECWEKIEKIRM